MRCGSKGTRPSCHPCPPNRRSATGRRRIEGARVVPRNAPRKAGPRPPLSQRPPPSPSLPRALLSLTLRQRSPPPSVSGPRPSNHRHPPSGSPPAVRPLPTAVAQAPATGGRWNIAVPSVPDRRRCNADRGPGCPWPCASCPPPHPHFGGHPQWDLKGVLLAFEQLISNNPSGPRPPAPPNRPPLDCPKCTYHHRCTRRSIFSLVHAADLSACIDLQRPVANVTALSDPGAPFNNSAPLGGGGRWGGWWWCVCVCGHPPPIPLKRWGQISFRAFSQSEFFFGAFGAD